MIGGVQFDSSQTLSGRAWKRSYLSLHNKYMGVCQKDVVYVDPKGGKRWNTGILWRISREYFDKSPFGQGLHLNEWVTLTSISTTV